MARKDIGKWLDGIVGTPPIQTSNNVTPITHKAEEERKVKSKSNDGNKFTIPDRGVTSLGVSKSQLKKLKHIALIKDSSLQEVVYTAFDDAINKYESEYGKIDLP